MTDPFQRLIEGLDEDVLSLDILCRRCVQQAIHMCDLIKTHLAALVAAERALDALWHTAHVPPELDSLIVNARDSIRVARKATDEVEQDIAYGRLGLMQQGEVNKLPPDCRKKRKKKG